MTSLTRFRTAVLASLLIAAAAQAAEKPNILFLLSDDHSYPYLGCYGNPDVRTPNLDRLAGEGMRFDRMFVSCPQCVPSRAALMTGRSPVAVRMVRFTSPLPADLPALPDLLRDQAGYFTGVGGRSYHLDGPSSKGQRAAVNVGGAIDKHNLRTFAARVDYVEKGGGMKDFGGKLAAFLDKVPQGKPWFFWLGFSDPHHVWNTQGPRGSLDPAKLALPPHLPDLPGVRGDLARYLAEIEHLDADVQDVLDTLQKRGQADNTIVVFMGDNGLALPHGKGALHDPGIAVPLIVRWPGMTRPGQATQALISGEDFAPTMLQAAGVTPPKAMSGVSFLKLLRGEPFTPRKYIFAERGPHGGDGGMKPDISAAIFDLVRCVRSDRYKLIYNCTPHQPVAPVDSQRDPSWQEMKAAHAAGKLGEPFVKAYFTTPRPTFELYDLQADPGELRNLAGDPAHREAETELKRALTEKMVLDWDFLPTPLR
ncbi:MAG: Arylsulfatase [Planctomycetes bacterium ADurb.Bin126]|nr:MAG: Arylsulfatase [Planctomycetes bacterium ADurb.Bin126]HOD82373.1 sulfatase [Phycisphaerae bacterium]HQL73430.1 sulfatase [Phycisphaerae bacterium]